MGESYPKLKEQFTLSVPVEKVLRYAMAVYQPNTPLKNDYPEWQKRKEAAATLAGYDLEDDAAFLEALFAGVEEFSMPLIHAFLRHFVKSRVWAMIESNEETFWEYNLRLKKPISKGAAGQDKDEMAAIEKKSKLAADQEVFHERINRLTAEFFAGDEDVAEASVQPFRMTPQQIAKQLAK